MTGPPLPVGRRGAVPLPDRHAAATGRSSSWLNVAQNYYTTKLYYYTALLQVYATTPDADAQLGDSGANPL